MLSQKIIIQSYDVTLDCFVVFDHPPNGWLGIQACLMKDFDTAK
jgi:hypothetical protein